MSEPINAGSPAPAPVVCARCGGVIEPGLERCPTCGAPQSHLVARGGTVPRRTGSLIGILLSITGMLLPIAWLWPGVFRQLGFGPLSDWLEAGGHRVTMLVPVWLTMLIGYGLQRQRSRAALQRAWTPFAAAPDGQVVSGTSTLEAGVGRPRVEARRGQRWLLTLDTVRDRSTASTRLRCAVAPRRDFHFLLMPQSRVLRALSSPRIGGFLLMLGRNAVIGAPADQARDRALEEAAFVVGPPIGLGEPGFDHAFLLKSDDADAARAFFGDQRGNLLVLSRPGSWWQLSLAASVANGTGQLEYRESGEVRDAARLDAVQQAMTRVLEGLAAGGFIAADSPASKP